MRTANDATAQRRDRLRFDTAQKLRTDYMEQRTDEQLMLAFVRGEVSAFDELFLRYWGKLRAFFVRRMAERSRAEELAQDTLLAVFRGAARYEPRALFRTYLYAIAFKVLQAERRKARLRSLLFLPPGRQEPPARAADTEEVLWIRKALQQLHAKDREVLMLREYDELSYAEIGAVLEIPVNTVRSRLFRARQALREILAAQKNTSLRASVGAQEEI